MNEEITINEEELVEYIAEKSGLSKEEIVKVLDLEFEFLKLKGVVE